MEYKWFRQLTSHDCCVHLCQEHHLKFMVSLSYCSLYVPKWATIVLSLNSHGLLLSGDKTKILTALSTFAGESSSTNLQLLDNFLSQSSENESNDDVLVCHMCKITFTSLYNKRSHYLGKIHSQTLVERLNKLLDCERLKQAGQGGKGREHQQLAPPPADHLPAHSAHEDAAVASSSHDSDLVSKVGEVDLSNRPDNELSRSLYKEQLQTSTVGTCEEGAEPISGISSEENGPQVQEADSEHVAMETVETPGILQCNSSPTVSKRVPTDLPLTDHSTSSARSHFSEGSCDLDTCDMVSSYLHRCATAYQGKPVGNATSRYQLPVS